MEARRIFADKVEESEPYKFFNRTGYPIELKVVDVKGRESGEDIVLMDSEEFSWSGLLNTDFGQARSGSSINTS
jgi:hypothetical protein